MNYSKARIFVIVFAIIFLMSIDSFAQSDVKTNDSETRITLLLDNGHHQQIGSDALHGIIENVAIGLNASFKDRLFEADLLSEKETDIVSNTSLCYCMHPWGGGWR
jgi:hypothetical protein